MSSHGVRLIMGTVTIENGEAGLADNLLRLWIPGMSMMQAAGIVFDSEKTKRIVFEYGEMQDVYEGYTECENIMNDEGVISVCMRKGEGSAS